jgi:hypothetical protein
MKLFWWMLYFNDNASLVVFSLAILCKRGVWTWLWTIIIWVFKALLIYIALGWFINFAMRFNFLAAWTIFDLKMNMVFSPWLNLYGYIEIKQSSCKMVFRTWCKHCHCLYPFLSFAFFTYTHVHPLGSLFFLLGELFHKLGS